LTVVLSANVIFMYHLNRTDTDVHNNDTKSMLESFKNT